MVGKTNRSENGFTFDTCVGIKLCKNPNLVNLLTCRLDIGTSKIHISSQTIVETRRLSYDIYYIIKQIELTGAQVIRGHITDEMKRHADYMESQYSMLHAGDSEILAYAHATGTTMVTCDRDLACATKLSGIDAVNPDLLPCDRLAKNSKLPFRRIVNKARQKQIEIKQKIKKSMTVKSGEKILWRAFN